MNENSLKPKKRFTWIGEVFFFVGSATISAAGVGIGWRWEHFGWAGLIGLACFWLAQWRYQRLGLVVLHGLLTGYLIFLIANPWMKWTIAGLLESTSTKTVIVTHGIHFWHGGSWCLFAIIWWAGRKMLPNGWLLAPLIWLLVEAGYPAMFPIRQACLLLDIQPLTQIAAVLGVTGVTLQALLIASVIPLVFATTTDRISRATGIRCLLVIAMVTAVHFAWGSFRIHRLEAATETSTTQFLNVGLIQGDTEYAEFHLNFVTRSNQLAEKCELIAWPECSLGHYERAFTDFSDDNEVILHSADCGPVIRPWPEPQCKLLAAGYSWTRHPDKEKLETKFVSAYLIDEQESTIGRHDKIELMAGGEYTPGANLFPALAQWLAPLPDEDDIDPPSMSRGSQLKPIGSINGLSLAVLLCCEDMYPWLSRAMTNAGADVLIELGNGMSFNSEIPLRQHFNIARFRAIENNRYFIRCGSFGVSGLISPSGTILKTVPCFAELDLLVTVPIEHRPRTAYSYCGPTLNVVAAMVYFTGVFIFGIRSRQRGLSSRGD